MPESTGLLSHFYLKIGGADPSEELMRDLLEIGVESGLHLPDAATLVLHDPRLRWVDDASLEPGKTIEIWTRFEGREGLVFDGEIVELEPDFEPSTQSLVVRAFDRLHRLARGRKVRSFQGVTDADLVQKLAQEAGLQASVGPTPQVHEYVFQANETDLEFLRRRSMALGYLLYVDRRTLHCEAPASSGGGVELKWGENLKEFQPRLTTVGQVSKVMVRGWDPEARQAIVGQAQNGRGSPQIGVPESGGQVAQSAFRREAQSLVANRPIRSQAEADRVAQAMADQHASGFVEAEGTCLGNPGVIPGASVRVSGVGSRFSGTYFVTGATHAFKTSEGYTTRFGVSGLRPSSLLGLLAPEPEPIRTDGLVIGVVTDNQDPKGQGRVKVKYPWLTNDHASDWARVVVPGGGPQRGIEFLPEVDDEVLVGFELGDVHHPYVLGGLWNGQDEPPKKSTQVVSGGKVQQRIIKSRSGHVITLDDTSGGEEITIVDKTGSNKIVLHSPDNSLQIKVQGDLTIEAQGKVKITGTAGVEVSSSAQLKLSGDSGAEMSTNGPATVKGSTLNMEGSGRAVLKGATVGVEGSGPVSVRGTPIQLN